MSTNLPKIIAHIDPEIKRKMEYIAHENDRSLAKELAQACKAWIKKYEIENGEID